MANIGMTTIPQDVLDAKNRRIRELEEENMVLHRRINALGLRLDLMRGEDRPKVLTTTQAAKLLQISTAQVGQWIRDGVLPAFQVKKGGDWRILYDRLMDFIEEYTVNEQEQLPV